MNDFAFVCLSKEFFRSKRRARKQLLYEALLRQSSVQEILYVNPHRHRWQKSCNTNIDSPKMHVRQETLMLPGERLSWIRAVNRWNIYRKLKIFLAHRTFWQCIFYNPFDVTIANQMRNHGNVFLDWTDDWAIYYGDAAMQSAQKTAVKTADGVIAVTESLRDRAIHLIENDRAVILLPNATAFTPLKDAASVEVLSGIPSPRIGYIGHLGPWFDKQTVLEISRARPDWHWVLVGNADEKTQNYFSKCANVHKLGPKPFNDLQHYMSQCQVLVAPYVKAFMGDSTKLYDYLTVGLPIVSANTETAQRLESLIRIASEVPSWLALIEKALNEKKPALCDARKKESQKHTWDTRACSLLEWMQNINQALV
jgi:glycosyltransferase involved in cell wall biosynthesis